jgi:FkbM family methyltransferase
MSYRHSLGRSMDTLLGRLADALPINGLIYRFCRRYIYRYNGENNVDIHSNGEMRWLNKVLGECQIVFDVGANIGDWTTVALNINPKLQAHCFEPGTATFQRVEARLLGDERVVLHQMGLSSSAGEMNLYLFGDGSLNSAYRRSDPSSSQTEFEKVQVDTLDAYCTSADIKRIDLLKLDVEGHELRVLQGANELLSQGAIQYIQFEYGGTYIDSHVLLKDMFELFHAYDYRLYKIYPDKLLHVARYEQRIENFHYQNWVASK